MSARSARWAKVIIVEPRTQWMLVNVISDSEALEEARKQNRWVSDVLEVCGELPEEE